MKNNPYILLCALVVTTQVSAATGSRSDDFVVIAIPALFLLIVGLVYWVKAKWKARKVKAEEVNQPS